MKNPTKMETQWNVKQTQRNEFCKFNNSILFMLILYHVNLIILDKSFIDEYKIQSLFSYDQSLKEKNINRLDEPAVCVSSK